MSGVLNSIGEAIANLVGAGPNGGPLGGFKQVAQPIDDALAAIAAPVTGGLSLAVPAAFAASDVVNGNYLGALGSGLSVVGGLGGLGAGGAGTAGAGATSAGPAAGGFGTSLSDFISSPSVAGLGNIASAAGANISSGWDTLLSNLGIGTGAGTTTSVAAGAGGNANILDFLSGGSGGGSPSTADLTAATLSGGGTGVTPTVSPASTLAALGYTPAPGVTTASSPFVSAPTITVAGPTSLLDTITGFPAQHPILTLGGGLLASEALSPVLQGIAGTNNLTSQEQALLNAEQPAIAAESELINSEETGVLPPGAQAAVSQGLAADIANIQARYAATGQSGSSAEQQDIANAQQQAAANQFNIASQATSQGLTAANLTDSVYNTLVQDQLNRQQQLQNAFASFFQALGLGSALSTTQSQVA